MKSKKVFLAGALLVAVFFSFSCGGGGNSGGGSVVDSITIDSVTPLVLTAGKQTTFTISVTYSLQTKDSGIIDYGFKSGTSFTLETDQQIVSRGTGSFSFVATKTLDASVSAVVVLLSEYPHASTWSPLVSADQTITVKP